MAIALKSAGIKVSFAVESTKNQRPTSGYTHFPGIKEIPDFNPAPETLETTTLDNLEYKTYTIGLKDVGGSLSFTAQFTQDLYNTWDKLMKAYQAGVEDDGKETWMCIDIPGLDKSTYFTFEPAPMGLPPASVNTIVDVNLYITATSEPIWEANPTYAEAASVQATTFKY